MDWKLFLDDERLPVDPENWIVCRTVEDAIFESTYKCPSVVSFDHDLGDGQKTGMDFARYLVERDMNVEGRYIPDDFVFEIHSQNPVGRDNIAGLLNNYLQFRKTDSSNV